MTTKRKKPRNLRLLVQKDLERRGWVVGVVERQTGPVKRDLFGVADLLAFNKTQTVLVQVTSREHAEDHRVKLQRWCLDIGGDLWRFPTTNRFLWLALVDQEGNIAWEDFR